MLTPSLPSNEVQRLATLRALHLLDTPPEERFDRITRLAASLFNVPVAMINLIEDNRQWSKSLYGTTVSETSREISFCAHTILENGVFIVSDTILDSRFSDNPVVKGSPWVRFYAGYPLHALDGTALGALCIIDQQPRQLSATEAQVLQDLSAWTENEINAHQISQALLSYRNGEVERMKSRFISHVSHELRTPLTVMRGYLDLFMGGYIDPLSPRQQDKLTLMQESTNQLIALVENLQDIFLIDAGQLKLQPSVVNLTELIRECCNALLSEIDSKQQMLTLNLAENLPSVSGDASRLKQIFTNLLSNAHQYTPTGGLIQVTTSADAHNVSIEVQDTGSGLSSDEQARLFNRFFRAESHMLGAIRGIGLGLSLTQALVEMHGGSITVAGTAGHGSIFRVLLPLANIL